MRKEGTLLMPQSSKENSGFLFKNLLCFDSCCFGSQSKENTTKSGLMRSTQMTQLYFPSDLFHLLFRSWAKAREGQAARTGGLQGRAALPRPPDGSQPPLLGLLLLPALPQEHRPSVACPPQETSPSDVASPRLAAEFHRISQNF